MNLLKQFFSYDFLLYINRVRLETADTVFAIIAAALVVVSVVLRLLMQYEKHAVKRGLLKRLWTLSITIGLLGVVWYGARVQLVGVFGTRLAFLLLLLVGLIWFGFILRYWRGMYGRERKAWDTKQLKDKYLQMQN